MARKQKEQLRREHLTDQQYADLSKVFECIERFRQKRRLAAETGSSSKA